MLLRALRVLRAHRRETACKQSHRQQTARAARRFTIIEAVHERAIFQSRLPPPERRRESYLFGVTDTSLHTTETSRRASGVYHPIEVPSLIPTHFEYTNYPCETVALCLPFGPETDLVPSRLLSTENEHTSRRTRVPPALAVRSQFTSEARSRHFFLFFSHLPLLLPRDEVDAAWNQSRRLLFAPTETSRLPSLLAHPVEDANSDGPEIAVAAAQGPSGPAASRALVFDASQDRPAAAYRP